jgi:bifunctional non-homologous end joining protein LigD
VAGRTKRSSGKKAGKKLASSADSMPPFIAPQLCNSVERPPAGDDWIHEIKFDGYRIQMRG